MITTTFINDDEDNNLRFDLSTMDCTTAITEQTTANAAVLLTKNKPLTGEDDLIPQQQPPFDASTCGTATTEYDDSVSVGSVSTLGSTTTASSTTAVMMDHRPTILRRSVFPKYWNTTGQEPPTSLQRRPRDLVQHKALQQPISSSTSNGELVVSSSSTRTTAEEDSSTKSSSFGRRRSIILPSTQQIRSYSLPSITSLYVPLPNTTHRKVISNYELSSSSPASCLRKERRFSGRHSNSDSSCSINNSNNNNNVRFDSKVAVLQFLPPLESYTEDSSWTDHFA
jgi:hypothetical protein